MGQALVEVAEKQVAGTSPAEQWSGCWSPAPGPDGHHERRSPGWLAARVGGGRESVIGEEGTEEPSPR